jgi:ferredoxin
MSIFVDDDKCITCGLCADSLPQFFELVGGRVRIKKRQIFETDRERLEAARNDCPGEAISI